jgi:hypothetical protein
MKVLLPMLLIRMNTASKLGPHKQTDRGRAPVWGSKFTSKAAILQGGGRGGGGSDE